MCHTISKDSCKRAERQVSNKGKYTDLVFYSKENVEKRVHEMCAAYSLSLPPYQPTVSAAILRQRHPPAGRCRGPRHG